MNRAIPPTTKVAGLLAHTYEYGRAIVSDSVGLEEGRTTLGKVQKHKVFYRKNEDGSVTKYTLDTTDITNDVHKWLADRGYTKVG